MADIFCQSDAVELMYNKHIVFLGDSNSRAVYKDLIWLLNHNALISQGSLKRKQEPSFCGDKLGKHSDLNRGRDYEEERFYQRNGTRVDFYFLTKCYNATLVDMMEDIHLGLKAAPDVICINSTLWDVSRWGPNGVIQFKDNIRKLARMFKSSLPPSTLVIWATSLPVSYKIQSSLLIKQIDFLRYTLRFDVLEANYFARQTMVNHGFDVLDNHFHMRMQVHRRIPDGVHYEPVAIRFLTNLLLTHIALSWGCPLPNRKDTILLNKAKALSSCDNSAASKVKLPTVKTKPNPVKKQNTKNDFPDRREKYSNKRNPKGRGFRRYLPEENRHPKLKTVSNRDASWTSDSQRGWSNSGGPTTNKQKRNPWRDTNYPGSNDYWPNEQRFEGAPQYPPGFASSPRFYRTSNPNPIANWPSRGRHPRYAPY